MAVTSGPKEQGGSEVSRASQMPRNAPVRVSILERKVLLACLVLLTVGAAAVLGPFVPWFVLALWTAALLRPMVDRLTIATRGRARASGLALVLLLVLVMVPVTLLAASVAADAYQLAQNILRSSSGRQALLELVAPGEGAELGKIRSLDARTLMMVIKEHGAEAINAATLLAGALGSVLLGVFVYFAATYAALVHGREAYVWLEGQLPISPNRLRSFRDAFLETGRGLLFSVMLTGVVQALIASLFYALLEVPRAAALGFATFVASFVPSVGTALVWAPVALGLFLAGHMTKSLVLVLMGVVVVSSVDNLLRPLFARWGSLTLDPFLVLFSMLGGVLTLGGWGLILGPLIVRLTLEATRLLREIQRVEAPVSEVTTAPIPGRTPQTSST